MTEHIGFWMAVTVFIICSFLMAGFIIWLRHKAPRGEYEKLIGEMRNEVSSLALAIGLHKRQQQAQRFGPPPVGP